jgi:hypothetical protein
MDQWIRIQDGQNCPQKKGRNEEIYIGLEASPGDWMPKKIYMTVIDPN